MCLQKLIIKVQDFTLPRQFYFYKYWLCVLGVLGPGRGWERGMNAEEEGGHSIPSPHSSPSFIHLITTAAEEKKKEFRCRSRANIMKYSILGKSASMAYMVAHTHRF